MSELVLRPWRKYGHDRTYVATAAGTSLGCRDNKTGAVLVEDEAFRAAVESAPGAAPVGVAEPEHPAPVVPEVEALAVPELEYFAEVPARDWEDLSRNRPGQAVREEAEARLAEMKEKSRIATFLVRAFDVKTDERAFRVGAAGEEAVGPRLEKLVKDGWHVLHSVPVGKGKSDIDHLVIGPGGVYTVNTKNHPGGRVWVGQHQVRVNGQPTPYLRNSRYEAKRVRKALSGLGFEVPVRAVLVFLTGSVIPNVTIKQRPDDVLILDRMDVPRVFKKAPARLSPEQVAAVFDLARRSTTWR